MKTIKIFLASSLELKEDREAFESFLYRKTKLWKEERNIFLELVIWEDYIDHVSKTRLQDDYDDAIKECDIFVMLFWTKVGPYTHEEFKTAWDQFQLSGRPLIYTYLKDSPSAIPVQPSLEEFRKTLKDLGHFETVYKNTEGLLLHFGAQLDKLFRMDAAPAVVEKARQKPEKTKVIELINKGNFFEAFEELNKFFLGDNDALNALRDEYIDQPNNFRQAQFASRLKLLISRDL